MITKKYLALNKVTNIDDFSLDQMHDYVISKFSIENHVKKRNPKHIFICGFSMGAMHATRYAIDYPGDVTAIVAVSHSMDAEKSAKIVVSFHNFKNRV